ncbi:hypothetical protein [uncultured Roseobacter sp.]|uniref:hypothetical protein n=1 Tax=uncultured Roseobacter sp. TaxID=114847 RepID=UPI00262055F8|nr:hypothetical protein [uncultured Roseobacter sp.]
MKIEIAEMIGKAMTMVGWSRRTFANNAQLRLDWGLDAGLIYRRHDFEIFAIEEDSVARTLSQSAGDSWLRTFPENCLRGLKRTPNAKTLDRLTIIDLALRTPPLGLAI